MRMKYDKQIQTKKLLGVMELPRTAYEDWERAIARKL